jgi:hypothetical protein
MRPQLRALVSLPATSRERAVRGAQRQRHVRARSQGSAARPRTLVHNQEVAFAAQIHIADAGKQEARDGILHAAAAVCA